MAYLGFQKGGLPSAPFPSLLLPFPSLPPLPFSFPPLEVGPPPFHLLSPSSPLPSLPLPLEVSPLIAARGSGGALKLPQRVRAEPGRQTVFGEFQAKNLASGSNELQELFRQ